MASNTSRRNFIRKTAALTGGAFAAAGSARAAPLPIPQANQEPGRIIEETAYGMPSKFEAHVKRRRTDVFKNRQNLSDWSMTPLQHQPGIITPNGLIFERHHAGTPDIDPKTHRLVIHGMVKQPLEFAMDDLHALPVGVALPFPRVLGQRPHRLAQARLDHRAADARPALGRAVDRRAGLHAARGSGHRSEGQVGAVRRRRRVGARALDPDGEGARRHHHRLRHERRDAAPGERLPGARRHSRLGRQRQREVAAPHQGRRPAVALPQRDRALHRPDARRQVAPVQHGDGDASRSSPRPPAA